MFIFKSIGFCILNLILLFSCASAQEYSYTDSNYGKTWMYFPDGDGVPHVIGLNEQNRFRGGPFDNSYSVSDQVNFELYTSQEPRKPKTMQLRTKRESFPSTTKQTTLSQTKSITLRDEEEFYREFQPELDTKIVIHGWLSNTNSNTVQNIKDQYLRFKKYNVIAVDWSELAKNLNYIVSANQTMEVGRHVAHMIDSLVERKGAKTSKMHLVGHSLGAHTAGFAGSFTSRGRVARITGLDPAKPTFSRTGPEGRLDPTDAMFVDVIHTCGKFLGIFEPLGHVDFYPNSGQPSQPGCNGYTEVVESCSHGRSHEFFAESINGCKTFYGVACDSWRDFKGDCVGMPTKMGDHVSFATRGIFFARTNSQSPYALGMLGINKPQP